MSLSSCVRLSPLCGLLLATAAAAQWEPDLGRNILDANDATSVETLPFAFPLPGGTGSTSSVVVSTDGWVKLTGTPVWNGAEPAVSTWNFLTREPRIAACAESLDSTPASNGFDPPGVFFRADPGKAVITWRTRESRSVTPIDVQLQLFADGSFRIRSARIAAAALCGVSAGFLTADPGASDLSSGVSGGPATIYERFTSVRPSDLLDTTLIFTPNITGYDVTLVSAPPFVAAERTRRGSGCPAASRSGTSVHERFDTGANDPFDLLGRSIVYTRTPSGYDVSVAGSLILRAPSNALNVSASATWQSGDEDDGLSIELPLGFVGTFWSTTTACVQINPNGIVYLGSGGREFAFGSGAALAAGPPALAVVAADLDLSAGGALLVDRLPPIGTAPAACAITWVGVPRKGQNSETVTAQALLFANGDAVVSFLTNGITGNQLTGFFEGFGNTAVESDLSALVGSGTTQPVNAGIPLRPLLHDVDLLALGNVPIARVQTAPADVAAFVLIVGTDRIAVDLTPLGMTGCTAYTAPLATLPMTPCLSGARTSMGTIPVNQALLGGLVTTQGLAVTGATNPLGPVVSNAVDSTLGF